MSRFVLSSVAMCNSNKVTLTLVFSLLIFIIGGIQVHVVIAQYDNYRQNYNNYYGTNRWQYSGVGNNRQSTGSQILYFDTRPTFTEGDFCDNNRLGVTGICRRASQCPGVYEEFRNGIQPIICSYLYNEIVVCCPKIEDETVNRFAEPRISAQKCEEYSKYAVTAGAFTGLSVIADVHQISIPACDYSTGLIVGGELAKHGEFPHMAAIGWTEPDASVDWKCGGSLISEYYVVTAGHCGSLYGVAPDVVRLGAQNLILQDDKNPPQDIRIRKVTSHPNHRHSAHYNDIALIELVARAHFTKFVRPACLWQTDAVNTSIAVATGWGQVEYAGERSNDLLKVSLDIVDNVRCNNLYERSKRLKDGIVDSQICAGYLQGGKDTCQGDSGGPIQITTSKKACVFQLIGITSFGKSCATINSVGVYTRISSFLDWIELVVWPHNFKTN